MTGNSLDYDGKISLDDYKKSSPTNAHQTLRLKLIFRLLKKLSTTGDGLDYGCGLGDITYRVSPQFTSIVGVDVTADRVKWANEQFAPVEFFQCGENELEFAPESFDTVLSSVVINWVEDRSKYLQNIHRVLRDDGHLVLLVKSPNVAKGALRKLAGKSSVGRQEFALKNIKNSLIEEGFTPIHTDCYYEPFTDIFTSWSNFLVEMLIMPARLIRFPPLAMYYAVVARKEKKPSAE